MPTWQATSDAHAEDRNIRLESAGEERYSLGTLCETAVAHDPPSPNRNHEPARVLQFRLRRRAPPPAQRSGPAHLPHDSGAGDSDDLARYEEEDAHIDYRQRMLMNVIGIAIVVLLVSAGVWIADTIANMEKAQDCAMQGRQNCSPIDVRAVK